MSVNFPNPLGLNLGTVNLDTTLDGDLDVTIPTAYSVSLEKLPRINLNIEPVEIKPIDFSLSIKEIPSIRAHLPLNYKVGFSILGRELACISLCGQGQMITEPYAPYFCEPGFRVPSKVVDLKHVLKADTELKNQ